MIGLVNISGLFICPTFSCSSKPLLLPDSGIASGPPVNEEDVEVGPSFAGSTVSISSYIVRKNVERKEN